MEGKGEENTNGSGLHHWTKGFRKVNVRMLVKALCNSDDMYRSVVVRRTMVVVAEMRCLTKTMGVSGADGDGGYRDLYVIERV